MRLKNEFDLICSLQTSKLTKDCLFLPHSTRKVKTRVGFYLHNLDIVLMAEVKYGLDGLNTQLSVERLSGKNFINRHTLETKM